LYTQQIIFETDRFVKARAAMEMQRQRRYFAGKFPAGREIAVKPDFTLGNCGEICYNQDTLWDQRTNRKGAVMLGLKEKLTLYGFNNLTKTLSFNIYDVCYAKTEREKRDYISYIDEEYNSERLTKILRNVTDRIGAHVLNISNQDYDPQGASVNVLVAEEAMMDSARRLKDSVMGHLDKSHLTVHTYPEFHPDNDISTFRVDIDVATCGKISPLNALDYLIGCFDSDIITVDYRIRGFTRDVSGKKLYKDHDINSIQEFIKEETLAKYDAIDVNVYQSNIFHTKMLIREIDLANYLFHADPSELPPQTRLEIKNKLYREMTEIYYGANLY